MTNDSLIDIPALEQAYGELPFTADHEETAQVLEKYLAIVRQHQANQSGYPVMTDRQMIERLKDALHRMVNATMYKDHPAESEFALEAIEDASDHLEASGATECLCKYPVSTGLVKALEGLKVTIKPTDSDDAIGYAATRNSVLNEAIAVARQDRFNPAIGVCGEISVADEASLRNLIHATLRNTGAFCSTVTLPEAAALTDLVNALRPYLRSPEPVSSAVSLEKCARALYERAISQPGTGQMPWVRLTEKMIETADEWRDRAKTVLDAAGVKYEN